MSVKGERSVLVLSCFFSLQARLAINWGWVVGCGCAVRVVIGDAQWCARAQVRSEENKFGALITHKSCPNAKQ